MRRDIWFQKSAAIAKAYGPYSVDDGDEDDEEEEIVVAEWNSGKKTVMVPVDRISSAVLWGVSHEGRLIDREACDQEQEGNRDTRVRQVQAVSMM